MHSQGTITGIKKVPTTITDMKENILEYCDPFLNAPAPHLKTGVKIDVNIVSDLLSSTEIGNEMFTKFLEESMKALEEKRIDFFPQHTKIQNSNWIRKSKSKKQYY